jgi:hypothetical protein
MRTVDVGYSHRHLIAISGVSADNLLEAFYDIHGRMGELLFSSIYRNENELVPADHSFSD